MFRNEKTRVFVLLAILVMALTASLFADSVTFQQGVDGYTGTEDLTLYTWNTVTNLQYGASATINTGHPSTTKQQGLIQFNDVFGDQSGQVPANAVILQATLELTAYRQDDSLDPGTVTLWMNPMLTDWVEGNSNGYAAEGESCPQARCYRSDGDYAGYPEDAWGTAGVAVTNGPVAGVDYIYYTSDPYLIADVDTNGDYNGYGTEFRSITLDITAIVAAWYSGELDNNGLYFGVLGWDKRFYYSSEYETVNVRPKLTITYQAVAVPENSKIFNRVFSITMVAAIQHCLDFPVVKPSISVVRLRVGS